MSHGDYEDLGLHKSGAGLQALIAE